MNIGGFEGLELVGSGGNAHVYRATNTSSGHLVAIKVLRGGGDEAVNRRFERERTLMAELETIANVVPIYESGFDDDGDPYLVMPLYMGGSLQDQVDRGPMQWRDAFEIVKVMTESIALAHAKRILHLDIKPANVLLDSDGSPWLADFGIAEMMGHTASMSAKMMTPAFTPPERLDGKKPSEQTDLYGLIATLYALLTGGPPYVNPETTGPMSVMMAIIREPLNLDRLADDTTQSVRNLLLRGMAKDPDDRPKSAIELVGLLQDVLDGRSVTAPVIVPAPETEPAEVLPPVRAESEATVMRATAEPVLAAAPADDGSRARVLVLSVLTLFMVLGGGVAAALALSGDEEPQANTSGVDQALLRGPVASTTMMSETVTKPLRSSLRRLSRNPMILAPEILLSSRRQPPPRCLTPTRRPLKQRLLRRPPPKHHRPKHRAPQRLPERPPPREHQQRPGQPRRLHGQQRPPLERRPPPRNQPRQQPRRRQRRRPQPPRRPSQC